MKLAYLMVLTVVLIFSGCTAKVTPCEPITITKKCEVPHIIKPQISDEGGDNVIWLKARLENYQKLESYVYDLEAAIEKCK